MQNDIKYLYFDIETVAATPTYGGLPKEMKHAFDLVYMAYCKDSMPVEDYFSLKAAVYAEFSEVACIGAGYFTKEKGKEVFKTMAFAAHDEKSIIEWFKDKIILNKSYNFLCGHNIKNFDIPYLCRRMVANKIPIPKEFNPNLYKKWELPFEDTLELWKFGQWESRVSLTTLCATLNVDSPKNEMTGADVHTVYWKERDLNKIKDYCIKDVIAVARCHRSIVFGNADFDTIIV